ncbi:hypothetical protein EVAR_59884_1 [Eumeta japonica]|uniref:Uncharacterized protein n=1 Tax=Eumeta variegata TaxID=151549 RepID=A0A4C1XMQ0_EUMVA|nr:hypothetical protein EVAR_59884_1 [Eumeta japonica]
MPTIGDNLQQGPRVMRVAELLRSKRACEPLEKWRSSPPVDTCNLRGVTCALSVSGRNDISDGGGVGHRNSYTLNEKQRQRLSRQVCILYDNKTGFYETKPPSVTSPNVNHVQRDVGSLFNITAKCAGAGAGALCPPMFTFCSIFALHNLAIVTRCLPERGLPGSTGAGAAAAGAVAVATGERPGLLRLWLNFNQVGKWG